MNNDLRYYGNPMNWESTKGDLISREALKAILSNEPNYIDDGAIFEQFEKIIDNAPTVKPCENCDLYFKAMTKAAELDKMPMIRKKHKGGKENG